MPDETPPGQEPTPSGQEPQPPASPPGQEPPASPERYDAEYVKELRRSEAATRKRLQDAEARIKALDDAQLSEQERTVKALADSKAEVERLRQERADIAIRLEVERQARQLNLVDEDTAYRLLDRADLADDAGLPKEIERRLQTLVKAKPFLVRTETTPPTPGVPGTPKAAAPPGREDLVNAKVETLRRTGAYGRF